MINCARLSSFKAFSDWQASKPLWLTRDTVVSIVGILSQVLANYCSFPLLAFTVTFSCRKFLPACLTVFFLPDLYAGVSNMRVVPASWYSLICGIPWLLFYQKITIFLFKEFIIFLGISLLYLRANLIPQRSLPLRELDLTSRFIYTHFFRSISILWSQTYTKNFPGYTTLLITW